MRTFCLILAYDGTTFHGWQRQPSRRTVQGELERALTGVLKEDIVLRGAGRTDAGVHARGQVASFRSATDLPARAISAKLARQLPPDIRVRSSREVPETFDARRSATGRRYAYRLLRAPDLLAERFAWAPHGEWSADALVRAVGPLEGRHDFASFQSAGSVRPTTDCLMHHAAWSHWEGGMRLDLVADRFLYRMVRNIVGTALQAAREPDPAAAMRRVMDARDRRAAGAVAPACGLTFEEVFYPEEQVA